MIESLLNSWRRSQAERRFRREAVELPDHLLRDIGLVRDRTGRAVTRHARWSGH